MDQYELDEIKKLKEPGVNSLINEMKEKADKSLRFIAKFDGVILEHILKWLNNHLSYGTVTYKLEEKL